MRRRTMPLFVTAVALLAACASSDEEGARSQVGPPEVPQAVRASPERAVTEAPAPMQTHSDVALARGEELFEAVCAQCHSMQPPPKQAPPMAMVVRHYRQALESDVEVRDRMIRWIAEPAPERSALPAHAIDRFGMMPPHPLPEADRAAVVDYLLSTVTADGTAMGGGLGMGAGVRGHGMGGGRGMRAKAGGMGMGGAGGMAGCSGGCMGGCMAAGGATTSASSSAPDGG